VVVAGAARTGRDDPVARPSLRRLHGQTAQHYTALAGLRTLPWTGMPMLVAPVAGILSDRLGSRPLMAAGLGMQVGLDG